MSLVAYAASSDEESDDDEVPNCPLVQQSILHNSNCNTQISDDADFFPTLETDLALTSPSKRIVLPPPKDPVNKNDFEISKPPIFSTLPAPKIGSTSFCNDVLEEDDEFLHKKAVPEATEKPPMLNKARVQISIPALSEFKDLENDKSKTRKAATAISKGSGLLSILPRPKTDGVAFRNSSKESKPDFKIESKTHNLIPDSVKHRNNKTSSLLVAKSKVNANKVSGLGVSDSEDSDNGGDFFSLRSEVDLPEVSINEINAMVAKKAAQMAHAATSFDKLTTTADEINNTYNYENQIISVASTTRHSEQIEFDKKAIEALVGSRQAKRRKMERVEVVELSGDQVLPNKEEWLRGALTSSTSYQPRGVLVDEEVAPGTRKKHQITYLAHQAKANEAELQAMWSANRQTRRQTQSKYGF